MGFLFGNEESRLELVLMFGQHDKYTKIHQIMHFKWLKG